MGILGEIPSVTYHLGGPPKWEAKQVLHHSPLRSWTEAFSLETIQEKDSQMKTWKLFERKWVFKGSLYDTSKQGSIFRRKSLQITMHLPDLWFCLMIPRTSPTFAWLLFLWTFRSFSLLRVSFFQCSFQLTKLLFAQVWRSWCALAPMFHSSPGPPN